MAGSRSSYTRHRQNGKFTVKHFGWPVQMSNQEKFDISGVDQYIYLRYNEKWCNYDRHAEDHTQREINSF